MLDALKTIAALLHKYHARQAALADPIVVMAETGDRNLARAVCGDDLWAEDGGLWDSGPQVLQRPHHDGEECRRDELAFRAAFVTLAEAIEREDFGDPIQRRRVAEVAETFRAWTRDGL